MKIATKFNLVLGAVFATGVSIAAAVSYSVLHANAREEVVKHAGMMMEAALSIRGYTIKEVKPLLADRLHDEFLPQTVPSYAATQNFNTIRGNHPEYMYKEATLNPTNPRDHATDWEADIIAQFRNNESLDEIVGERATPTGPSLYLARPIRIKNEACLDCHGTVNAAPATMVSLYGTANGFGWQLDEVVGSQIVSVPLSLPVEKANHSFLIFLSSLVAIFLVLFIVINFMLGWMISKPVAEMTAIANEISKGHPDVPAFDHGGKDEISELSASFNRMRVSLEKAMKMLDNR